MNQMNTATKREFKQCRTRRRTTHHHTQMMTSRRKNLVHKYFIVLCY